MDRDLLGFALPDGATFPLNSASAGKEKQAMQATLNGSAEHTKIEAAEMREWSSRIALCLFLDFITIACIVYLLIR